MAEESGGEKTEAPTPRRRTEAREEGNIARSADLTAAVVLLSIFVLFGWYGAAVVNAMRVVVHHMLTTEWIANMDMASILPGVLSALMQIGGALAPLFIGVMVVAVAANIAQVGLFLSGKKLQPNFGVLSPMQGLSRLRGQGPVRLGMDLLKLILIGTVAYTAVRSRMSEIISVGDLSYSQIFALSGSVIYSIAMRLAAVLLVLALIDYVYHRFELERKLRMTKHEVKEEMRKMEGDPKIKMRRRQIAIQAHAKRLKKEVPKADVIITNPTEFAIALQYDSALMHAPKVVAKGEGLMAARIREIAIEHGIPILERKPLARAIYKLVNVGQEIPEQFYSAIAEILAYVYELTGKVRRPQKTA